MLPSKIEIFGIPYTVVLLEHASSVHTEGKQALWGQIDYWKREIRIFSKGRSKEDLIETMFHEIFHSIITHLHLKGEIKDDEDETNEALVETIALSFFDILKRNNLLSNELLADDTLF